MPIDKQTVTRLAKAHPHSAAILRAFVPLLNARMKLVETLAAPELPPLDTAAFAQGKPWVPAVDIPLGQDFLKKAPQALAKAAAKGLPEQAEGFTALGEYLVKHPAEAAALTGMQLEGRPRAIVTWSKKHGFDRNVATLLAAHLAGAAAALARRAVGETKLPEWRHARCPICGGAAHAYVIRGKEGARYLQCGLCGFEYRWSRTACSACGREDPKKLPYFFIENHPEHQAEACESCRSYLLGLDARTLADSAPLELHVLCMLPLDALMQEKGYAPPSASVNG